MASASPRSNSSTPRCRSRGSNVTRACQSPACRARWSPSASLAPSTPRRRSRSGLAAIRVSSSSCRAVGPGCASRSRTRPCRARSGSAVAPSASSRTGSARSSASSAPSRSRSAAEGSVNPCRSSRVKVLLLRPGAVISASCRTVRVVGPAGSRSYGLSVTGERGAGAGAYRSGSSGGPLRSCGRATTTGTRAAGPARPGARPGARCGCLAGRPERRTGRGARSTAARRTGHGARPHVRGFAPRSASRSAISRISDSCDSTMPRASRFSTPTVHRSTHPSAMWTPPLWCSVMSWR